ncbi:MAG: hypothetical protein O3A85_09235, partial [Proteobacteria bacterium]|nr:hypothetical protein [Pseudomonadota bacterium]
MTRLTLTPILPALALIALTGCTTPAVDREMTNFNEEKFSHDLEFCVSASPPPPSLNLFHPLFSPECL